MDNREFYLQDDGIRIHCRLDFPERICSPGSLPGESKENLRCPLLILFHGFTGHMEEDHIRAAAEAAKEAGFAVLRAELYGHGGSGGSFKDHTLHKWISNALKVIRYAENLSFATYLCLCGHSQGGLLVMLVGDMVQDKLRAIIPLSPAWMIPEIARKGELRGIYMDPTKVPGELDVGEGRIIGENYIRVAQTIYVEPSIRRFRKPVLLVHGDADLSVPVEYSIRAAQLYENARLTVISGDTHCFNFHPEKMKDAVREFLLQLQTGALS